MDSDAKSVVITIPKPRKCLHIDKRFIQEVHISKHLKRCMTKRYRKPTDVSFQKISLFYNTPIKTKTLKRDELFLPLRVYTGIQQQDKVKHEVKIKYNERYKVIRTELQKRLHVVYPANDVDAVKDTDQTYYRYVNGRPISDRIPVFHSLKIALADFLRLKTEIGIRNDCILQIETNIKNEFKTYENSLNRFMTQAKYFESFISDDYQKSRDFLDKWDKLKSRLNIKLAELQNVAAEEFTIISRLRGLDYLYNKQLKYGRFLYYLSPPSWRYEHREFARSVEIEAMGFDLGPSEEETFDMVFEKMKKACYELVQPVLYFTHPHTLVDVFERDEKQQLHNFMYVVSLAPRKKRARDSLVTLKYKIDKETALVANSIRKLQNFVKFKEEICEQLKTKFFKILYGLFFESVGAPEVLKLFVHLEFVYERIFIEKPINMDLVTIAKSLENLYMDNSKRIDEVHSNTKKLAIAKCIEKERCKMRKARRAARELHLFEVLERHLLGVYEPPFRKSQTLPPSKIPKLRKFTNHEQLKQKDPKKSLTDSELEYLALFTDWAEGDDPSKYLHIQEHPL